MKRSGPEIAHPTDAELRGPAREGMHPDDAEDVKAAAVTTTRAKYETVWTQARGAVTKTVTVLVPADADDPKGIDNASPSWLGIVTFACYETGPRGGRSPVGWQGFTASEWAAVVSAVGAALDRGGAGGRR